MSVSQCTERKELVRRKGRRDWQNVSQTNLVPFSPSATSQWNDVISNMKWLKDGYDQRKMEAQEASELEQGLCKRDADDPVCKRFVFPEPFDRLLGSVRSPVK
jgi:hypothetical protein